MAEEKKLVDMSVKDFLTELASDSPAPGGGSVAALSGALAAALASMVCNLTMGKEKYASNQDMMLAVRGRSGVLRGKLLELIDEDTKVFNVVMATYKMPKSTDEEKKLRSEAIQGALKSAAETPLEVCRICKEIIKLAQVVAEKGNQNSITDAGAAALMADAAVQIAALNVKINLSSIKDEKYVEEMEKKLMDIEFSAADEMEDAMKQVMAVVDPSALEELEEEDGPEMEEDN